MNKSRPHSFDSVNVLVSHRTVKSFSVRYSQLRKLWMTTLSPVISAHGARAYSGAQSRSLDGRTLRRQTSTTPTATTARARVDFHHGCKKDCSVRPRPPLATSLKLCRVTRNSGCITVIPTV